MRTFRPNFPAWLGGVSEFTVSLWNRVGTYGMPAPTSPSSWDRVSTNELSAKKTALSTSHGKHILAINGIRNFDCVWGAFISVSKNRHATARDYVCLTHLIIACLTGTDESDLTTSEVCQGVPQLYSGMSLLLTGVHFALWADIAWKNDSVFCFDTIVSEMGTESCWWDM